MSASTPLMPRSALVLIGIMAVAPASADLALDVELGYSMPAASGYRNSANARVSIGHQSGLWLARAGFTRLGEFKLENGAEDTHLSSKGPFLMISRTVESQWVDWEFGLGAAYLESVATFPWR